MNIMKPEDIEKKSFEIITATLKEMGADQEGTQGRVLKRVIHATADFDYVGNLIFSENAAEAGVELFRRGCAVVTDTNMARSGVSRGALEKSGSDIFCYIADPDIAAEAKKTGKTRAVLSMEKAALLDKELIVAVGNAPTALIALNALIKEGKIKPALIVGVPVGFVNVVESKELIITSGVPYIVAKGRKGGSNVAAAILNALLYTAFPRDMDKG